MKSTFLGTEGVGAGTIAENRLAQFKAFITLDFMMCIKLTNGRHFNLEGGKLIAYDPTRQNQAKGKPNCLDGLYQGKNYRHLERSSALVSCALPCDG